MKKLVGVRKAYSEVMHVLGIAVFIAMFLSIPLTPVFNGDGRIIEKNDPYEPEKNIGESLSLQTYNEDKAQKYEKYFITVDMDLPYLMKDVSYLNDKSLHIVMDFAKEKRLEKDYVKLLNMTDLAYTLWCEERGSQKGMMYVASVILNRVASDRYPNTIFKVIHQKKQFSCWGETGVSPIHKVDRDFKQFQYALKMAHSIFYSKKFKKMTIATHYFASNKVNPYWASKGETLGRVGNHVFLLVK